MSRIDRAIEALGAAADHRATITAAWLAPVPIVLLAPDGLVTPLLVGEMGVCAIMLEAQRARRDL